jgi:two-component system, cell cycle sensor histidine kinase and response regulator CckA
MKSTNLIQQIGHAQRRLRAMQIRAHSSSISSKELQDEAIAEFSITLEELHVTTEELHAQNEELLESRQTLELERQRYQELFDFAPDAYLVTNAEGIIQQANCAATTLLNLRHDLVVGKPLIIFVDKPERATFHTQLTQLVQSGQSLADWEIGLRARDKDPFPVSISVSPILYDPQNQSRGFRWMLRDLSQRKQNEQKIREQAELLNVATDAILVCNLDYQIQFWNQSAQKLYGWNPAEALGQNMTELLHSEFLYSRVDSHHKLILQNGQWQGEIRQVNRAAQNIIVESHWTLIQDEENNPKSILIVNTDVTEKKQLELQLIQRQRLEGLGTLSRGIAHDLNNILTPILGIAQLLPHRLSIDDPQTVRLLSRLETSARRAIDLIKQIQLFAGGHDDERTVLHLGKLLSELEELAGEVFPKSITLHAEVPWDLWHIEGNSAQIHQILINLCVNARDAMPNGGILNLSVKNLLVDSSNIHQHSEGHLGQYVVMTVRDSGTGISADIIPRIFEPFFTLKDEHKSSGLGLSIVAGVAKNHNGFVTVSSRVGQGSQFQVFLPALTIMAIAPKECFNLPRGNAEFVLLVDDEASILETTQLILENFGYQVLTAQDGITAIALYRQYHSQISVVLMDMMMPSMEGEAAILGLKSINPQVKIIANSGLPLNHPSTVNVDTNIKALLPKPYPIERLLTVLCEVIHRSSTGD